METDRLIEIEENGRQNESGRGYEGETVRESGRDGEGGMESRKRDGEIEKDRVKIVREKDIE